VKFHLSQIQLQRLHLRSNLRRGAPIGWKQSDLLWDFFARFKSFNEATPAGFIRIVDLSPLKHLPFGALSIGKAIALDNTPVAMKLPVLVSSMAFEIHQPRLYQTCDPRVNGVGLPHKPISERDPTKTFKNGPIRTCRRRFPLKSRWKKLTILVNRESRARVLPC